MSIKPSYTYISADSLAGIVKESSGSKSDGAVPPQYAVVDVRDEDFMGGNIPNCIRSPSETFYDDVDELARRLKGVPKVIFHCSLSQQRGPKSARIYSETVQRLNDKEEGKGNSDGGEPEQEIMVLRNGFSGWQAKFRKDPTLVENWRAQIWAR